MLSLKGRESYIKMQMWLDDPHGVDKLRIWESGASGIASALTSAVTRGEITSVENTRKRQSSSECPSPSVSPPSMSPEKKFKLEENKNNPPPQPFDLFKLWFCSQQQNNPGLAAAAAAASAAAAAAVTAGSGTPSGGEDDNKSDCSEKARRKSTTPQQYLGSQDENSTNE